MGNPPNQHLRDVAQAYNDAYGLGRIVTGHCVPVDVSLARRVAAEYAALPSVDSAFDVVYAYAALARELRQQYAWLLRAGYTLQPWTQDGQPYADSAAMCADVRDNKHLWYFTGGEAHPYLGEVNNLFRAVHDVFGHAAEGFQFGPRGEENAWVHHSMMFSPLAQVALTTETRGQNSWVNYGPHADMPVSVRPYAPQKVALMPVWACDWRAALARGE
jgi:hypothetical protein